MTKVPLAVWLLAALAVAVTAFFIANRPRRVVVDAPIVADFPEQGFSHDAFAALLREFVTPDGEVAYDRWHASGESRAKLDSYLAALSRYSPEKNPERFSDRNDALAYWMYGYNAYVIKAVLDRWPLSSVTDVKAPVEVVKGLGFFYQLRFSFGGEYLSLLAVENNKIRKRYRDARIHFVLNCASESCPVMRPELPTGEALENLMKQATSDFINDPDNVSVNHESGTVFLSSIFKWYEKDFLNDLRAKGRPDERGLIDYVAGFAKDSLRADLDRATGYGITFRDYDWHLNNRDIPDY